MAGPAGPRATPMNKLFSENFVVRHIMSLSWLAGGYSGFVQDLDSKISVQIASKCLVYILVKNSSPTYCVAFVAHWWLLRIRCRFWFMFGCNNMSNTKGSGTKRNPDIWF